MTEFLSMPCDKETDIFFRKIIGHLPLASRYMQVGNLFMDVRDKPALVKSVGDRPGM